MDGVFPGPGGRRSLMVLAVLERESCGWGLDEAVRVEVERSRGELGADGGCGAVRWDDGTFRIGDAAGDIAGA